MQTGGVKVPRSSDVSAGRVTRRLGSPPSFLPSERVRKFVGNLQRDHAAGDMRRNRLEHLARIDALLIHLPAGQPAREAANQLRREALFGRGLQDRLVRSVLVE